MTTGWRLSVRLEERPVLERVIAPGVATIGRSAHNHIVLDGPRVSRFHAAVFVSHSGTCHVQDMGSRNGTFVGARRVGRQRLEDGDRFSVGPYTIHAQASDAPTSPSSAPSTLGDEGSTPLDDLNAAAHAFIGNSSAARRLLAQARRAADTDLNLLLVGESGSGKGVIARIIHEWSARAAAPFVVVNCAAIPTELVESELFGHRRGAFTGAIADRIGKFRAAHGGTLFLDEVGDLPLPSQSKILRAIEEQEIEPLGEPGPVRVNVRVLAATHHDLEHAIADGRFRLDLYHRLATVSLRVPALRERQDDIVVLANVLLAELIDDIPWAQGATFSSEAMAALVAHDWPGNVRELRNVIAQALLAREQDTIGPADLLLTRAAGATGLSAGATLAEAEQHHIRRALEHAGWNLRKTAKALGIARSTLQERMDRLGLARGGASRGRK